MTDEIERFTETGLQLRSGKHLDADLVITATGLKVKMLGGATVSIDGRPVSLSDTVSYKGMMYEGVPNLARLLDKYGARATFLFSLGPDPTGWALRRVFRPGFL